MQPEISERDFFTKEIQDIYNRFLEKKNNSSFINSYLCESRDIFQERILC